MKLFQQGTGQPLGPGHSLHMSYDSTPYRPHSLYTAVLQWSIFCQTSPFASTRARDVTRRIRRLYADTVFAQSESRTSGGSSRKSVSNASEVSGLISESVGASSSDALAEIHSSHGTWSYAGSSISSADVQILLGVPGYAISNGDKSLISSRSWYDDDADTISVGSYQSTSTRIMGMDARCLRSCDDDDGGCTQPAQV